jgi:hypothetical protein
MKMGNLSIKPIRILLNTDNHTPNARVVIKKGCIDTVPFEVIINDRGGVLELPAGTTAKIRMRKPGGGHVLNDCGSIVNNIIPFGFTALMQQVPGEGECEIILTQGTRAFTTVSFPVKIEGNVHDDSQLESLPEYTSLLSALVRVEASEEIAERAYEVAAEADTFLLMTQAAENARAVWEPYDQNKDYVKGNKVSYQGSSYINKLPCKGVSPTNTTNWGIIAAKGDKGETGSQGIQGQQGDVNLAQLNEVSSKIDLAVIDTKTGTFIQSTVADDYIVELTRIEGSTVINKTYLTFDGSTITAKNATAKFTSYFAAGDTISITGCINAANNISAVITTIADFVITCSATTFASASETVDVSITNGMKVYSTAISPENPATITNASNFDVVACGKNLLPKTSKTTTTINGITFTPNSDGSVTISGTSTATADFYLCGAFGDTTKIAVTSVGDYVLKGSGNANVTLYVGTGNTIHINADLSSDKKATFSVSKIISWYFIRVASGVTVSGLTVYPQLELGSISSTYEPYKSNKITIPSTLRKNPYTGICDYRQKDNDGIWREYIKMAEVVFDGSSDEIWGKSGATTNDRFYINIPDAKPSSALLCGRFKYVVSLSNSAYEISMDGSKNLIVNFNASYGTESVTTFKAWLASNPITVSYEIATTISSVIPNQILISYKNITNIYTTFNNQVIMTAVFKSRLKNTSEVLSGMPATNLVSNSDFNGTVGWNSYASNIISLNNSLLSIGTGAASAPSVNQNTNAVLSNGRKYYISAKVRVTNNLCTDLSIQAYGSNPLVIIGNIASKLNPVINQFYNLSGIVTATTQTTNLRLLLVHTYANPTNATNSVMEIGNALCIDLTEIFGIGNEPTITEMDTIMSKYPNAWFRDTVNPLLTHKELMGYLNKNKANIKQEDWISPTLLNGFITYVSFSSPVKYYKDNFGTVHLKGTISSGTAGLASFVLPVGYRPITTIGYICRSKSGTNGSVGIDPSGNVYIVAYDTYICLDGITFRAEQ